MSFEDVKQRIEAGFIEPLQDFRQKTAALNTIHNDNLTQLAHNLSALLTGSDGQSAFKGAGANALSELVGNFIQNERKLSGNSSDPRGWDLTGRLGDAGSKNLQYAVFFETILDSIQHAPITATQGIDHVTEAATAITMPIDIGAGAQLGIDIPWDIVAALATGITLGLAAGDALAHLIDNPDQLRANAATAVLDQTVPKYEQDMRTIESNNPLPPQMQPPKGPSGDYKPFLLLLGLAVGAGGTVLYLDSSKTPVNLTDAQKRLLQDVKSRLGNTPYNEGELEALIRAGYLDPDAIAAMIKGGTYVAFNDANVAKMMNTLTGAQQLQFVTIVERYQQTHPGLTSHQVYNYLQYIKMKAQLNILSNNITGHDPTDPISQAIASAFPAQTQALNQRLYLDVGNSIDAVTDPFTVNDNQLKGWYANLTGKGGEWASIKQYYQQGKLVDFGVPLPPSPSGQATGEVDIKIRENGVEKWVELKNVLSPQGQWGSALAQARKYAQNGATDVVLQFPQLGVNGNPNISQQQLNNLQQLRRAYPGVTFEVRTGASNPDIRIPFDPPSSNWGAYLP